MNTFGFLFTLVAGIMLFRLPRQWAFLPLLMGATFMTREQVLDLGVMNFTVVRLLVTVGFLRVMSKGERIAGGINVLDKAIIAWASWLLVSSVFHGESALVFRVGLVWSEVGAYFLFRVFIRSQEDLHRIIKAACLILLPVAAAMLFEKITGRNLFAALGGMYGFAAMRHGQYRAAGPFAHAILAGTVGAMCFPLALHLWKSDRKLCLAGLAAAGVIVFSSGSSGPVMMVFATLFAMTLWKVRQRMRAILWLALVGTLALDIVMNDPVYFLMARIDITGGSTGWHRAALIRSALDHLGEWWFSGTDYTRHWMPTGIHANANHTDITNHILQMGVWGGLPLVFLFFGILVAAFSILSKTLRMNTRAPVEQQFLVWMLGSVLFGHVINFFSISYFDHSIVYYYMLLAGIASYHARVIVTATKPAVASKISSTTGQHEQNLCHNS